MYTRYVGEKDNNPDRVLTRGEVGDPEYLETTGAQTFSTANLSKYYQIDTNPILGAVTAADIGKSLILKVNNVAGLTVESQAGVSVVGPANFKDTKGILCVVTEANTWWIVGGDSTLEGASGDGVALAPDIATLANADPTANAAVYVHNARGGLYRWNPADLSAQVAIDTLGIYYVSRAGEDGTAGAWVLDWSGNARASWATSNDWVLVMQMAGITAQLFPRTIIELEATVYQKNDAVKYPLSDINLVGKGADKTIIRQNVSSPEPLVAFGHVAGTSNGNASISHVTIDGDSLCTVRTLEIKSTDNVRVKHFKLIGWRYGLDCYSDETDGQLKNTLISNFEISNPDPAQHVYPLRFNAPWGTEKAYNTTVLHGKVIGAGGHYSGPAGAGTADQVSFQHCDKVRCTDVESRDGGELGFNASRGCTDIIFNDCRAINNDADGFNLGSGQHLVTVASTAGFAIDDVVTMNGSTTGIIEYISTDTLYLRNVSYSASTRLVEVGDTVVAGGTNTTITAILSSADECYLYNCRAYSNSRDEAATGNLYAGLKLNLASNVFVYDCNFSSAVNQQWGMSAVNSTWYFQNVQMAGNLTGEWQAPGRTKALIPNNMTIPSKAIGLESKTYNIVSGVVTVGILSWIRARPETGSTDTITDIVNATDGQVIVLNGNAVSTELVVESNARLRIGHTRTLKGTDQSLTLIYRAQGVGFWMPLVPESYKSISATQTEVINTVAETTIFSETIPANTLGAVMANLEGYLKNSSGAGRSYNFKLKIDGVELLSANTTSIQSNNQERHVSIGLMIINRSAGDQKVKFTLYVGSDNPATGPATDEITSDFAILRDSAADETSDILVEVSVTLAQANTDVSYVHEMHVLKAI